ncbi:GNAT family N-acetyltransferase [Streptomyces sp. NPDC046685]|uniref:GNAT family N-acetyltransferase n=1 Tax=Streptomyces sp. NPDC046685 TaxID=3157202 RepID=UPI0033C67250
MTLIRTARPDELPALFEHPDDTERNDAARAYLGELLEARCTRPEWCLVAEDGGRLVGSVVLWTLPGQEVPYAFVLFEAAAGAERAGADLLEAAAAAARGLGAQELEHVVDSPAQEPQFQREPKRREELLSGSGFQVIRDGRRFRLRVPGELPADDPRLTFRSLTDLGRGPFVDLLEELLVDTADARLTDGVRVHGARGAAERLFEDMTELTYEPDWWEIGYDAAGAPAVISLPARNPSAHVIGFVGVAPAHRGNGYAASVVVRGTRILAAHGATEIRGDCDAANTAMAKAFGKAGYENFADRLEFSRAL